MNKQSDFIEIVRAAVMTREIHIATSPNRVEGNAECRAHEAAFEMARAVRASRQIPDDMTAEDAAEAFLKVVLSNTLAPEVPDWLNAA